MGHYTIAYIMRLSQVPDIPVSHLPIMSPNTVATTNTLQSNIDTAPLLARGHAKGTPQSRLSRLFCKITKKPDDITVAKELTEWSRHGTSYLEETFVCSFATSARWICVNAPLCADDRTPLSTSISRIRPIGVWRQIWNTSPIRLYLQKF